MAHPNSCACATTCAPGASTIISAPTAKHRPGDRRSAPTRRSSASDGGDVAAALQTIREIGDAAALDSAITDAFPGSAVTISEREGYFEVLMHQHGLLRPLSASELSEGTLRYLLLVAALLTPRPPPLMVLNEPEASLHPDLLAPLARLIATASARSQIVVVSHAPTLVAALEAVPAARAFLLEKRVGETIIRDDEAPGWTWPSR